MNEEILNDTPINDDAGTESDSPVSSESTENVPSSSEAIINELNEKILELSKELDSYKQAKERQDRIAEQLNEFSELFPNIAPKAIPAEVWESVQRGNTLVAAYAVYEKRIAEAAKRIEQINARNAGLSAGAAGKNASNEFFSADEVRKMSPAEVRANFAKIRRSMEKWN